MYALSGVFWFSPDFVVFTMFIMSCVLACLYGIFSTKCGRSAYAIFQGSPRRNIAAAHIERDRISFVACEVSPGWSIVEKHPAQAFVEEMHKFGSFNWVVYGVRGLDWSDPNDISDLSDDILAELVEDTVSADHYSSPSITDTMPDGKPCSSRTNLNTDHVVLHEEANNAGDDSFHKYTLFGRGGQEEIASHGADPDQWASCVGGCGLVGQVDGVPSKMTEEQEESNGWNLVESFRLCSNACFAGWHDVANDRLLIQ